MSTSSITFVSFKDIKLFEILRNYFELIQE